MEKKVFFIDRFEGDFVIVETEEGVVFKLPRSVVPENAAEGACLFIEIDEKVSKERKNNIKKLMDELWQD